MIAWMKSWIVWFLMIPQEEAKSIQMVAVYKSAEKLADFERWAFGDINSHNWTKWQRERIWNIRHADVYQIPEGEYFRDHMPKIIKIYDEYRKIAGIS